MCAYLYIFLAVFILYIFAKRKYLFWKNKNVYNPRPKFFYGNIKEDIRGWKSVVEVMKDYYDEAKGRGLRYFGVYKIWRPALVIIDLDLIKCILQKDFIHFANHSISTYDKKEILAGNLFTLKDEKWRDLRAKLTPTFTSGKIKMMFETMVACANPLKLKLKEYCDINDPVDIKDILTRFTTDVIGSVAFGVEINCMDNPDNEFTQESQHIFTMPLSSKLKFLLRMNLPKWIASYIHIRIFKKSTETFFVNLVKQTVEYREKNNVFRKDFMHLLIQLKNLGRVDDGNQTVLINNEKKKDVQALTINEMAAQAFVFFLAGFETSATTMTFALFELAQEPKVQEKLRKEISKVLRENGGLTYDGIMNMEYLEMVILETLRKHPPIAILPRACGRDFKVPDTDLIINAGTSVDIPVHAIHRDPEHFPNPDKFDPERFNATNRSKLKAFSYLPFGEGPRMCIGLRFGKLQVKVGLCTVLQNYRVSLNKRTKVPIKYKPSVPILTPERGIWLNLEKAD